MNVNYQDKSQDEEYDPLLWNAADANEVKLAVNSKVDSVSGKTLSTNDYTTAEKNKLAGLTAETTTSIKTKLGASTSLTDGYLTSEDFNIFNNKVSLVSGVVPASQLPPVYFNGLSGTGTQNDPYVVSSSGSGFSEAQLITWFQSRPNFAPDRVFGGDLEWHDVVDNSLEKLATPSIGFGTPQGDSVQVKWTGVTNATAYTVQRASDNSFTDAVLIYTGALLTYLDAGLTPLTQYFYRLRATANGFAASNFANGSVTTDVQGNTTPATPTAGIVDDTANTFNWTYSTNYTSNADYEYTINGGSGYTQVTAKPISIGDVALAINKVGVRVKAASGRNVSGTLFNTTPYTLTPITPPAPTSGIVDNDQDTFDFTYSTGYTNVSDYEYTINGGTTVLPLTSKPLVVGDVSKAIGQVRVRVKAASGRNVSAWLQNTVAYTIAPVTTVALTEWPTLIHATLLNTNDLNFITTSGEAGFAISKYYIPVGGSGFVQESFTTNAFTAYLLLDKDNGQVSPNSAQFCMQYDGNLVILRASGVYLDEYKTSVPSGANSRARISADGTNVKFEYSLDGGATWVLIYSAAQPADKLYVKAFENVSITTPGRYLRNIRGYNLSQDA